MGNISASGSGYSQRFLPFRRSDYKSFTIKSYILPESTSALYLGYQQDQHICKSLFCAKEKYFSLGYHRYPDVSVYWLSRIHWCLLGEGSNWISGMKDNISINSNVGEGFVSTHKEAFLSYYHSETQESSHPFGRMTFVHFLAFRTDVRKALHSVQLLSGIGVARLLVACKIKSPERLIRSHFMRRRSETAVCDQKAIAVSSSKST
ncbi:hypothetical protein Tco_1244286 [Tanacetum coccineum]